MELGGGAQNWLRQASIIRFSIPLELELLLSQTWCVTPRYDFVVMTIYVSIYLKCVTHFHLFQTWHKMCQPFTKFFSLHIAFEIYTSLLFIFTVM